MCSEIGLEFNLPTEQQITVSGNLHVGKRRKEFEKMKEK